MPPARRSPKASVPPPGREGERARAILYVVAALGFVGLGIVFWLSTRAGGVDSAAATKARTALEAAGCTLELVRAPTNVSDHSDVTSADDVREEWTTDPPTAGPHYGETAVYGAYTEPLQQARVIHNLEHGAVVVQYGPGVPAEVITDLRSFYDRNVNGTLLAPYTPLGDQIALGAWIGEGGGRGQGVLARCPSFDDTAFQAFLTAYQFRGPERFSPTAMAPGSH